MRKNASGKTILKHFIEMCADRGLKYYPVIPWDERNINEQKEFYDSEHMGHMMDLYFTTKASGWTVKDFIFRIPDLARELDKNDEVWLEFKKIQEQTKLRMREAGYEV